MRTEIHYKTLSIDGRIHHIRKNLDGAGLPADSSLAVVDVYLTEVHEQDGSKAGTDPALLRSVFLDPVAQEARFDSPAAPVLLPDWEGLVEVSYRAGVTNPVAITAKTALEAALGKALPEGSLVQTARQYLFQGTGEGSLLSQLARQLYNPLIEQAVVISRSEWDRGVRPPALYPHQVAPSPVTIEEFDLDDLDDEALAAFSRQRLLALSVEEMRAIQAYYLRTDVRRAREKRGLPSGPTDVELEMLAQTWSEHCKHKILNAKVLYREGDRIEEIDSLFKTYIKGTTDALLPEKPYLKSLFHDNSGVVDFDEENLLCFKVETHNSPSALDPYGGAITGIVGVNRDILGTGKGARPIFNTNVLCFGEPDTPAEEIPQGLLHPRTIMRGVHQGIIDGGNQSGIPTVGGAFLFDESYRGKPLVFCGTGGILPREIAGEGSWIKHIDDGDITVMVGGRIGKDGIHGATFSSLALDEESPTSAVQIGDPITQKKMADFLLEARDKGLYKGITDNGAGGLSSSLGEMAEYSGGIRADLDKCPLKYPGLAPWEIWVSESQERMSLAVDPATLDELLALARKRDVEATPIGEFTSTGTVSLYYEGQLAGEISLDFLHDGLPVMTIPAELNQKPVTEKTLPPSGAEETEGLLYALLAEPNIASKEPLVRQYDHEVQIQSVTKPFVGARSDGPSDGAVLRPVARSYRGVTVTHGICPWYAPLDAYRMAQNAVDEAFRAHIALGGDPNQTSVLDNFCWPDPVESASTPDGPHKMAQLVQTCRGLQDACLAYKAPLISGKDSMKNDAQLGGKKVSVKPTLLVSLMGITPDCRNTPSTDFKNPGDLIYLLGETRGELGGTFYEKLGGKGPLGSCPEVKPEEALPLYRSLHRAIHQGLTASCHDLSDGGLGVALAESALAGRLGAEIDLARVPCGPRCGDEAHRLLFCETPSRFLVSVAPENRGAFEETLTGRRFALIGSVTESSRITVTKDGAGIVSVPLDRVTNAWKKPFGGEVE